MGRRTLGSGPGGIPLGTASVGSRARWLAHGSRPLGALSRSTPGDADSPSASLVPLYELR